MAPAQTHDLPRPTPADPMPGRARDATVPDPARRNLPPELGPNSIAILEGRTFMFSNPVGDVPAGSIGGLVHADTRFIDRWLLTVNGAPLLALRSGTVDAYSAVFFLTNPKHPDLDANSIGIRRLRFVGGGMHERIEVESYRDEPLELEVRLGVGNDFADLFEIKSVVRDRSKEIVRQHAADGTRLAFRYANGAFEAETVVEVSPVPTRVEGDDVVWSLALAARGRWSCTLSVPLRLGPREIQPVHADFDEVFTTRHDDHVGTWEAQRARHSSGSHLLDEVIDQSVRDLLALRLEAKAGNEVIMLPGAGLPWFLTLFGRDTLITAYQTVAFGPRVARGALMAIAFFQGTKVDDFRDEEPGKMPHELRTGELTVLGLKPHSPYYGSADSTMLWLILLSEYWRWTADDGSVLAARSHALAALDWIDRYGDMDGDGYVEYQTRSPQGLGNQCWRDSLDGVLFADGTMPVLPIATCEIQGYVYDAKMRLAELADGPLADPELATRLRADAAALRERFERDFWIDARGGYYAIGLDGDKRPIDSMTSNIGHLLWSGIVSPERAAIVARQLMSDAMYSGWGVRTLSTDDDGFNPIGYHRGTVWPHDNSLIAHGLARYGFRDEANRIALDLLDAAGSSAYRLPEAFSGYARSVGPFPVPYPTACSPQAWATGAPLLLLRTVLGLDARDGRPTIDPVLPPAIGSISIDGLWGGGTRWDIEASGSTGRLRPVDGSAEPPPGRPDA
jgi:glycogen debranching enzyme